MGIRKYPARRIPRFDPSACFHRFAERDADVLDGVVLINVEIAARGEFQIEAAVARNLFEHVIEETNAGRDLRLAAAVEIQFQPMSVSFVIRCEASLFS